jgi:hypothetical protein
MTTRFAVLAVLVAAPSIAHAEKEIDDNGVVVEIEEDPITEMPPETIASPARLEAIVGLHAGNLPVQQADLVSLGFDLQAGVRFDRLALLAECDLLWLPDATSTSGTGRRFGLDVNYSIFQGIGAWKRPRGYPHHPIRARADLWLTAGVGEETLHVNVADLSRRDVALGIGGHIGEEDRDRHWLPFAGFFTLRLVLAHEPDPLSGASTRGMAGPSGTGALDYALWFDWGFVFGG